MTPSGKIRESFLAKLFDAVDIVEVIGRRIQYARVNSGGLTATARCPFHSERTPSFSVDRNKGFYHCFGCGAHGDAIDFLREHDGVGFHDAVEMLAQDTGLQIEYEQGGAGLSETELRQREAARQVVARADVFYRGALRRSPEAIAYLRDQRGITGLSAKLFGLGYAPSEGLAEALGAEYASEAASAAHSGLVQAGDGRQWDFFRDRILFPVFDVQGRVIAWSGRTLKSEETLKAMKAAGKPVAKYKNSPDTLLYHKKRELYGLYQAQAHIAKQKSAIVVEGNLDVIMASQHGICNVVAPMGTAITEEQIRRLLTMTNRVVFCFDGDRAGREAMLKAARCALGVMRDKDVIEFVSLPDGADPDSLLRTQGCQAFQDYLLRTRTLTQVLLDELTGRFDLNTLEGRAAFANEARTVHGLIVHAELIRELWRSEVARLTGIALPTIKPLISTGTLSHRILLGLLADHRDLPSRLAHIPDSLMLDASTGSVIAYLKVGGFAQIPVLIRHFEGNDEICRAINRCAIELMRLGERFDGGRYLQDLIEQAKRSENLLKKNALDHKIQRITLAGLSEDEREEYMRVVEALAA